MDQRRVFERIEMPLKIKYEIIEKPPLVKDANSRDISGGGIKLALDENLAIGTNLRLDIEIPGEKDKTTTAYGRVIWNKKIEIVGSKSRTYYETGIQFTKIDPLSIGKIFKRFPENK